MPDHHHPARALGLQRMQVGGSTAAPVYLPRRAEVIDVMVCADQNVEVFNLEPDLRERLLERRDALGRVHPSVDQNPFAMTIDQPDIDDGRPHRQRQEDFVDSRVNLNDFRGHQL
jgi:hypothetical protein